MAREGPAVISAETQLLTCWALALHPTCTLLLAVWKASAKPAQPGQAEIELIQAGCLLVAAQEAPAELHHSPTTSFRKSRASRAAPASNTQPSRGSSAWDAKSAAASRARPSRGSQRPAGELRRATRDSAACWLPAESRPGGWVGGWRRQVRASWAGVAEWLTAAAP